MLLVKMVGRVFCKESELEYIEAREREQHNHIVVVVGTIFLSKRISIPMGATRISQSNSNEDWTTKGEELLKTRMLQSSVINESHQSSVGP